MALLPREKGNGPPPAQSGERVPPAQPGESGGASTTGMNALALNGIRMLYDENAFEGRNGSGGFKDMIQAGDDGAAQVAVTIGEKVFRDLKARNKPIDDQQFMEAAEVIIDEIVMVADRIGAPVDPDKVMFLAMTRFIERNGDQMDLDGMQQSLGEVTPEEMQQAVGFAEQAGGLPGGTIA